MTIADYYLLGDFHRPVRTSSPDAQAWFDRGLVWCHGFNHEEAVRCFEQAVLRDPHCAMAHWGLAYALGPNYNRPWDLFSTRERETIAHRTHEAVLRAVACAEEGSAVERALAQALRFRYPRAHAPEKEESPIWNTEYADAMAAVAASFPDDLDVAMLYADAMMNLTPWALWDIKTGKPAPGARTLEIKRVIERATASSDAGSRHPGLLHLYIHLMEMSDEPELALPAADRLRDLVPDAGHLKHMPSHIYILVGDYERAVAVNTAATVADDKFLAREGPLNFYTLYRAHNLHFKLYAAMFAGQSAVALKTASQLEAAIPDELLRITTPPMADWLEAFLAMRIHVLIRFGRWADILALPLPSDADLYCVTVAFTHYARGVALAATGRVDEARRERAIFAAAVLRVKPSRTLFNNRCVDILALAEAMLDGEIDYRAARYDEAFAHLRHAIHLYDTLPVEEPWGWMQPVRHAYGALLLERGRVEEALAVYAADLGLDDSLPRVHQHPRNVWALHGYHECLEKLGRKKGEEAERVGKWLEAAVGGADVAIASSCFCRTATAKM